MTQGEMAVPIGALAVSARSLTPDLARGPMLLQMTFVRGRAYPMFAFSAWRPPRFWRL